LILLAQQKGLAKCGLDITQHQLLFCFCAAVVGDGILLIKNFYLELLKQYQQSSGHFGKP